MRQLLLVGLLLMPASLAAQQAEQPRTISVSAVGTIEREPEQGVVMLAVVSEAQTADAAASANAEKMTQVIAALREAGIPQRDIRTVSYELRPQYARERDPGEVPRIAGYVASNMVQVTVDSIARLGEIIDTAIASGANRVTNIGYQLRDQHAAHLEALAVAVRRARAEAQAVAAAAGEPLGEILRIDTGGYSPPPAPMPMFARAEAMDMAAATPIETGTLTVTAHVSVVFRIGGANE